MQQCKRHHTSATLWPRATCLLLSNKQLTGMVRIPLRFGPAKRFLGQPCGCCSSMITPGWGPCITTTATTTTRLQHLVFNKHTMLALLSTHHAWLSKPMVTTARADASVSSTLQTGIRGSRRELIPHHTHTHTYTVCVTANTQWQARKRHLQHAL